MKNEKYIDDYNNEVQKFLNSNISFQNSDLIIPKSFQQNTSYAQVRLGEFIRGMNNVSPMLQTKPHNVDAKFVSNQYFIDAQKEKRGNLQIINDVKKEGYLFTIIDHFFDKNLNGVVDPDEKLPFQVLFFMSSDGNKVREAYNAVSAKADEILFFIESEEDTFSSRKLYAKVSNAVRKQFYDKDGKIDDRFFSTSIMSILGSNTGLEIKVIKELLEKGTVEKSNIYIDSILKALKLASLAYSSLLKGVGWICSKLGEGIDYLKITDDFWDTQSEEYFFDRENIIKLLTIPEDSLNELEKLFTDKKGIDLHDITPDRLEKLIKENIGKIKGFVRNYNKFIRDTIEEIYQMADNKTVNIFISHIQVSIAFYCGLWNGIVDFVSSLLKFVGGILQAPFNTALDFQGAMETVDNINEFLFGGNFWNNLGTAISETFNKLVDFCKTHEKDDYDWVRVAYVAGSAIAFIASFFVPFTQVLKVAKLGAIADIIAAVNKEVGAALSASAKFAKDQAYKALSSLLEIISKGGKSFRDFLKRIWSELEKWFLNSQYQLSKLITYIKLGFDRESAQTLANLGIKPKLAAKPTGLGAGIPISNFITRLEYKGIIIKQGTKKQITDFAKQLKEMGKDAAIKYLDDLLDGIFIIGRRFEQHIEDGHIRIKKYKADNLVEEYEYLASKGGKVAESGFNYSPTVGGFHILNKLNNKLVRIAENLGTKVLPTGETVRLAKIEYWIKEMGKWVLKKDTHTFFPSKWDINKIKKVVQEASENITFKQGNKYRGITKQGIEIEFYISTETREITTAYIYFK
ncbi:EndoU domain-containing protein [Chryseobacterium luquanense]|uniref:EndoU domain-containing protein n=1 Tax=Chryseobacterium luquanense TaxID=2983766 RepID=A0ABT3Y5T4_9FLAO|nr:EndoU domain-containing protein [Chryseobacterium luquanense]MCX8533515.1 EndoU domain-containing protein [Chryseobacterium luquanense]